jgi:hypothetical protein
MSNKSCKHYQRCCAPMCPMDENSLKCIWYPDEEICMSSAYGNLAWIKAQKKIFKALAQANRYFTFEMLKTNCVIRKGIIGLDPNNDEKQQLQRWLKEHPSKRILSEEEKKARTQRIKKYQFCSEDNQPSLKGQDSIL